MRLLNIKGLQLKAIAAALPDRMEHNYDLIDGYKEYEIERICNMTGIFSRRTAPEGVTSIDLMYKAVKKLLEITGYPIAKNDCIICVTQTSGYNIPGNSYILCHKLNLGNDVMALDINAGCPGFTHGLITMGKILDGKDIRNGILVVGDTLTKLISDKKDKFIYGDGAAACLVSFNKEYKESYACWKTVAEKYDKIISWGPYSACEELNSIKQTDHRTDVGFYMDGQEIFSFGIKEVPEIITYTLAANKLKIDNIDLFAFHQPNRLIIDYIGKKLCIPHSKIPIYVDGIGSAGSASIPITLCRYAEAKSVKSLSGKLCFTGFGAGLSLSTMILDVENMIVDPLTIT